MISQVRTDQNRTVFVLIYQVSVEFDKWQHIWFTAQGKLPYFWILLHKLHFKVLCGLFQVRPPSAVLLKKVPSTWLYSAQWWQWWSALPKVNDIYFGLPLSFSIPLPQAQMLFIDAFSLNAQPSVIPSLRSFKNACLHLSFMSLSLTFRWLAEIQSMNRL